MALEFVKLLNQLHCSFGWFCLGSGGSVHCCLHRYCGDHGQTRAGAFQKEQLKTTQKFKDMEHVSSTTTVYGSTPAQPLQYQHRQQAAPSCPGV
jgi:hypothetical protein